ncbi:hypothetical protein K7432_002776 [Basidiobolus ranarum]|uniref:F-box domain-containing protein n=1 Tax=Basidiobolus ranarum TaxID=34480 RepID=A0ABR2W784_9FUNG
MASTQSSISAVDFNPHCLSKLFRYIEKDQNVLYSCTQVNRNWCTHSIEILYKNPWNFFHNIKLGSKEQTRALHLLRTLANSLDSTTQGIDLINLKTGEKTVFNYYSFVRSVDLYQLHLCLWLEFKNSVLFEDTGKILWQTFRERISPNLRQLVCGGAIPYVEIFPPGIQYPRLTQLEVRVFNFGKPLNSYHCRLIADCCSNITTFRFSHGNKVHGLPLEFNEGDIIRIIHAQKPNTLKNFSLQGLRYIKLQPIIEALIERHCESLTTLTLENCISLGSRDFKSIALLSRLQSLNLPWCVQVDNDVITYITEAIPYIKEVNISGTLVTDLGICNLVESLGVNLRGLNISYLYSLNADTIFPVLAQYSCNLSHLALESVRYTYETIWKFVPCCPELELLILGIPQRTSIGAYDTLFKLLSNYPKLQYLDMVNSTVTQGTVDSFERYPSLKKVRIAINGFRQELILRE